MYAKLNSIRPGWCRSSPICALSWLNTLSAAACSILKDKNTLLGSWSRRLLLEHLIGKRNLARNTQSGYREALALLLPFASRKHNKSADTLNVTDLSADIVRMFLTNLETSRKCS